MKESAFKDIKHIAVLWIWRVTELLQIPSIHILSPFPVKSE